jgi:DNA-binding sugar fermentation-stimulating protein
VRTWVEVKNVTLVEDGVARIPDAVTLRGRRHLTSPREAFAAGVEAPAYRAEVTTTGIALAERLPVRL